MHIYIYIYITHPTCGICKLRLKNSSAHADRGCWLCHGAARSQRVGAHGRKADRATRKGTNGVRPHGFTANFMFRDLAFWVPLLTYVVLPKRARAYLFPQSVKSVRFCSGPISADPICPQPSCSRTPSSQMRRRDGSAPLRLSACESLRRIERSLLLPPPSVRSGSAPLPCRPSVNLSYPW